MGSHVESEEDESGDTDADLDDISLASVSANCVSSIDGNAGIGFAGGDTISSVFPGHTVASTSCSGSSLAQPPPSRGTAAIASRSRFGRRIGRSASQGRALDLASLASRIGSSVEPANGSSRARASVGGDAGSWERNRSSSWRCISRRSRQSSSPQQQLDLSSRRKMAEKLTRRWRAAGGCGLLCMFISAASLLFLSHQEIFLQGSGESNRRSSADHELPEWFHTRAVPRILTSYAELHNSYTNNPGAARSRFLVVSNTQAGMN
jgi:hypothetical protein